MGVSCGHPFNYKYIYTYTYKFTYTLNYKFTYLSTYKSNYNGISYRFLRPILKFSENYSALTALADRILPKFFVIAPVDTKLNALHSIG